MEWVKLSAVPPYYLDGSLLRAGEAAEVLFCRALAYCGSVESKGRIDKTVLPMLVTKGAAVRAEALVREGLWTDEGTHYRVRSWDKHQEEHDAAAERKRKDRERKRAARRAEREDESKDVSVDGVGGLSADVPRTSAERPAQDREGEGDREGDVLPTEGHTPRAGKPPSEPPSFAAFWHAYPRRIGRKAALTAYTRALKNGADADAVLSGAERYAAETATVEARFIAHPTSWLNAGRWDDEPAPMVVPTNRSDERAARNLALIQSFAQPSQQQLEVS